MLSLLLTAAISCPEAPGALCPPCHPEEHGFTFMGFLLSIFKSLISLAVIVYPLYKTFKAWESNRVKACRAMLAYWSAITLLNAMKEMTDEVVGNWFNAWLHHLIVAAIKLAPLVVGPDAIYEYTVRPFFEHHEDEIDAVMISANVKAQEVKADLQSVMKTAQPYIDRVERAISPSLEQMTHTLVDTTHRVEHALGLDKDHAKEHEAAARAHLTPEDAVKRDEELTLQADPTSLTGLRQRSKQPTSATATAEVNGELPPAEKAEIEKAKARDVLVEKIVWGHGLSAKNDEYQRQQKQRAAVAEAVTLPQSLDGGASVSSGSGVGMAAVVEPPVVLNHSHPPLSAFPLPPAAKPSSEDVRRLKARTGASAEMTRQEAALLKTKSSQLLDSNSIQQVVMLDGQPPFSADQQKEL